MLKAVFVEFFLVTHVSPGKLSFVSSFSLLPLAYLLPLTLIHIKACTPLWYKWVPNDLMKLFCWCVWGFWIAFHLPMLWVAKVPAVWRYYQLLFVQSPGFASLSLNYFMFNGFVQRTQLSFKPDFKRSIIFTVFQIQTHKLARHLLISLKTQLDFSYPFPYDTTKKYSVESETTVILAVAVANCVTPQNGLPGRWAVTCGVKTFRAKSIGESYCGTSNSSFCPNSRGQRHVSLLYWFSTNNFISSPKVCIFRVVFPNTDAVLILCSLSFHLQHSNINILVFLTILQYYTWVPPV